MGEKKGEKHGRREEEQKREKLDMRYVVVRFVTLEFGDYALVWWTQVFEDIRMGYTKDLKSVEGSYKVIEMDLMRTKIRESEEATIARFLHSLNREVQDVVDLQQYATLGELVHQATKVEMQIKRRSAPREPYLRSNGWKGKDKEKEKIHIASQCSNRRVVVLRDSGEVKIESSSEECSSSSEVEALSNDSHYEGDLLMVRRLINGGICVNVASLRLVKKLALPTFSHPKTYKLQWLSEKGELIVDRQVEMAFNLGSYKDKVVCDVVHMEATHLLLGRPLQYDKRVIHDGVTNRFTFKHLGQKVVLTPLSPKV
ncbi:hypothetical protein CR513_05870, partial [Mucuna pruriens]